jgi:hypothetical protein
MSPFVVRTSLAAAGLFAVLLTAAGQGDEQPKKKTGTAGAIPGGDAAGKTEAAAELKSMEAAAEGKKRPATLRTCLPCHANLPAQGNDLLVWQNESNVWANKDLHSKALATLDTPYGKRMGELLGYTKPVTQMKECLICHATDEDPKKPFAEKTAADFYLKGGVSCQACHGVATEKWVLAHADPEWRKVTPAEKVKAGQTDLRDPVERARVCAGCHVGNASEGAVVTHEMYAAGHPPLPSFELATFSMQEPFHWMPASDVPYFKTIKPADVTKLFHYTPGELEQTKLVAIGALISLSQYAHTLQVAAEAAQKAEAAGRGNAALDLTHFDCYACHHDLKRPSWRQKRGYPGTAGRPVMRGVATELVQAVTEQADPKQLITFGGKMGELNLAFDARPFGDPAQVAKAAKGLADWCDEMAAKIRDGTYDAKKAKALLDEIAKRVGADRGPHGMYGLDYDTARQLTWAYERIDAELNDRPYAPWEQGRFKKLDDLLKLKLKDKSKWQEPLEKQLPLRLETLNNFSPEAFFADFKQATTPAPKEARLGQRPGQLLTP